MPYTTIDKGSSYFNTVLYTGNGSARSITGVGFKPDWVWVKPRSAVNDHVLADVIRGVTKTLATNSTAIEGTNVNAFTAFGTDGFSLGTGTDVNSNTVTYASWNWLANGTGVSNTSGSITSTVSANTTSGFSIVTYTGNLTAGATVGHGLGIAPSMIIIKNRSSAGLEWLTYHKSLGNGKYLALQSTSAQVGSVTIWGTSSTTFTLAQAYGDYNGSGNSHVAYCFAEIKGYSKFGSYTGNGSTNGTFVYTGFKPAFVMWKRTDASASDWDMYDSARDTYNLAFKELLANATSAESSSTVLALDMLSNGFKLITSNANGNASGGTYIYMAFASNPFVSSKGLPCTAR
jgi:hypothetical protein